MTTPADRGYAGAVSRTLAFGLDAALVATAATGAALAILLIGSVLGTSDRELARAVAPAFAAALPALLAVYNTVFWALAGRTPGMALLGIRVVATRDRPVSWLSALVRAVVLGYFPIGALWCLVDRRSQAVHDKLARTVVVRSGGRLAAGQPDQGGLGRNRPSSSAPF